MKMIVHHYQKEICLRIEKMKTIPVMAIIKEISPELSYFLSSQNEFMPVDTHDAISSKKRFFILLEF